jgi:hypothetical protein
MKTSDLSGPALDWAVSKCEGIEWEQGDLFAREYGPGFKPSIDWAHGGPIIEREWLDITPWPNEGREDMRWHCQQHDSGGDCAQYGPTPLVAAMRCYVASKLGEIVEVPDEIAQP